MSLGEKLQQLRKSKGLSQDQLAESLNVSRQAISKWELSESMPDTENILQISRFFAVSTDYLLNDDIDSEDQVPSLKVATEHLDKQYRVRMLMTISLGFAAIGIIFSLVAWFTWQTILTVSIGFIIQLIGVIIFEALISKYSDKNSAFQRRRFYSISIWLLAPTPVFFLVDLFFRLAFRPIGAFVDLALMIVAYIIICTCVTNLLRRKNKTAKD